MSADFISPSVRGRRLPPAAIVFACALFVRLCALSLASGSTSIQPDHIDMKFYSDWARRIAAGAWTDHQAFYGLPGYAYWLALIYKVVGYQPFLVSLLQQGIDACTATLLFQIGSLAFVRPGCGDDAAERRRGTVVGGLAAAGWTLCTSAQAYSMALMPTAYLVCAFWFVVWWVLRARRDGGRPRTLAFLGLGLLMGVVAMMVANILFLVPFVLAAMGLRRGWQPFPWRARAGAAAALVGGVLVGASPCALHNYLLAGEPVFLSAHGGINFYIGNNPHANGYPLIPPPLHADQAGLLNDSVYWAERTEGRPLKRSEVSAFWSKRAHRFIAEHPGQWVQLLGVKLANFWNGYPYDDLDMLGPMRDDGVLLPGVTFGLAAMFGLPGLLLAVWRRPRARWVAAAVGLHMASLMTVFVTERYRLATVPGLLLLGSYGLVEAGGAFLALGRRPLSAEPAGRWAVGTVALYAFVLLGAAFATHRPVGEDLRSHDVFNGSLADIEEGRYDRALEKLDRVLRTVPNNAETYFAMGNAWLGKGDADRAADCYRRTVQLDGRHYRALNNLAVIACQQKQPAAAEQLLVAALTIYASDAKANYLLACARKELGHHDDALAAAEEAVRLRPDLKEYRQLRDELAASAPDPALHTASAAPAVNPIP